MLICTCSIFATVLNIEGSRCINQINSSVNDQLNSTQIIQNPLQQSENQIKKMLTESYELEKYCFAVTNFYVYSLFGIIIGFIILAIWYMKFKSIWSRKSKKLGK